MVTKHGRCFFLLEKIRKSVQKRLELIDIEHDIQRMEAELSYHKQKTSIFEEVLREQQHILSRLQRVDKENCLRNDLQ